VKDHHALTEPDCALHRAIAAFAKANDAYITWRMRVDYYEQEEKLGGGASDSDGQQARLKDALARAHTSRRAYQAARVWLGDCLRGLPAHLGMGE